MSTAASSSSSSAGAPGARGKRADRPEDKIVASDWALPALAYGAHAAYLYSRWLAVAAGAPAATFLAPSLWGSVGGSAAYLAGVAGLYAWASAPGVPVTRCRAAMIVHNVYCSALSGVTLAVFVAFVARAPGAVWTPAGALSRATWTAIFEQPLETASPGGALVAWAMWAFWQSKFVDFLDTAFMLARKSFRQVSFLHVEHHAVMPLVMFVINAHCPGGPSVFAPLLNSGVHLLMYAYYAFLALRWAWPLPKVTITLLQIAQFLACAVHAAHHLARPDAKWPLLLARVEAGLMVNMLILFGAFFWTEYCGGGKAKAAAKAE